MALNLTFAVDSPQISPVSFGDGGGPFRLTTKKWPNWFVYMQDNSKGNLRGYRGPAGDAGEFVFTRIGRDLYQDADYYLISQKKWSNWFLFMQDNDVGNVRGWEGDPGPQGHWKIEARDDGSFLLSTKKWPQWYMYMQDNDPGNVRGWKGDPGPQGHFMMACNVKFTN